MNNETSVPPAITLNNILEAYFPFLLPLSPANADGSPAPAFERAEAPAPATEPRQASFAFTHSR